MITDPFYGIYDTGKLIARWLNRLLLVAELGALVLLAYFLNTQEGYSLFWLAAYVPASFFAIGFVNRMLRKFWEILLTIFYGTTDIDIIDDLKLKKRQ